MTRRSPTLLVPVKPAGCQFDLDGDAPRQLFPHSPTKAQVQQRHVVLPRLPSRLRERIPTMPNGSQYTHSMSSLRRSLST